MEESYRLISNNETQTEDLGEDFGRACRGGEVFLLCGNLGAGKTRFTQGLARGLGVKGVVNSPTFNIMKIYHLNRAILGLCHIDVYRLSSAADLEAIGAEDYIKDKKIVTVIEWADKVKKIWPVGAKVLEFKESDDNYREIIVSSVSAKPEVKIR